jgi:RNA polymerase II subunit A small phosphatase-like protein
MGHWWMPTITLDPIHIEGNIRFYKRHGLDAFLQECNTLFTLAVWSAASKDYVEAVVTAIFIPLDIKLAFVWSGARTTRKWDHFNGDLITIKPLRKIWRRKQWHRTNTLIVDDTPRTYCQNYGNAIRIATWSRLDTADVEFERVLDILRYKQGRPVRTDNPKLGRKVNVGCRF